MLKSWLTAICCFAAVSPPALAQATSDVEPLSAEVVRTLDDYLKSEVSADTSQAARARDQIWRGTGLAHGAMEPLLHELKTRQRAAGKRPAELRILRLLAHIQRRLGETAQARRTLDKIKVTEETVADTLGKAEILDALGRNAPAIETYDRLLKRELPNELRNRILLRKALIDDGSRRATKAKASRAPTPKPGSSLGGLRAVKPKQTKEAAKALPAGNSPLAKFAKGEGVSAELRNQAAVILALTGEQTAAIDLFQPSGEGTARFRQEIRIAEWALEAKALPAAQKSAWAAVRSANLKRDRRYALTILVEAYRRAGNLDDLIRQLATAKDLDTESREVWIDLLREQGKVEEALKLFRDAKAGVFTADMRRELLEICRETNQDETLENAYISLIKTEPHFLEWRKGLTSFYLERGRRDEGTRVWDDYLTVTKDSRYRMAAAQTLSALGLDELAEKFARTNMAAGDLVAKQSALLFLFEMHHGRGRLGLAREILGELHQIAPPSGAARKDLADAYERLGDLDKAVKTLTDLRAAMGDTMTPDTRMKLALLLSKTGDEEEALEQWRSLWLQVNSVPRRRYVEERLMTVASRLGVLAKMAISLEKKLIAGTADARESGLLVRLYIKVNDPVSATEIVEEHMRQSGKKPVDVLTEKARVFQSCQDYYNYELVIAELLKVDPEGRPDYLRQLAMSMMERGQRKEARDVLARLKEDKTDEVSDEFEAGVLAIAGMRKEALQAYRRGIARAPERIDTYLLLSNMQRTLGLHTRSAGMFQYLTATAERDDLFTIAVDGILNMRAANSNAGAPDRIVEWTRRAVLERLASRPDKLYLYRLVADLSEELNDSATAIRSLKAAVPVAGEQRTQMLRELMTMARNAAGGNRRPTLRILASGAAVSVAPKSPSSSDLLMFGRRILGQAELVPPDVYIELGSAFLASGDVSNAIKTFNQASRLPEFPEMRRRMAQSFELAGYPKEALRVYERILSVENRDVGLITKVGELREQTGSDDVALDLYRRGIRFLLDRSIFATTGNQKGEEPATPANALLRLQRNRNSDNWAQQYSWLVSGLLATMSEAKAKEFLQEQAGFLDAELRRVKEQRALGELDKHSKIAHHPRINRRCLVIRRVANACRQASVLDEIDKGLLAVFDQDDNLLEVLVRDRLSWGRVASAQKLVAEASKPGAQRNRLRTMTGTLAAIKDAGSVSVSEATNLILPLLSSDRKTARQMLERVALRPEDKSALENIPMLVGATSFLNAPDLTLSFCRHWIDLAVRHSPGLLYQTVQSILETGRRDLDKPQLQSLTEHVLTLVIEQPDKFTVFVQRLSQLRDTVGPDFLTRQQIQKLIEARLAANDRFIFGIEQMIVMLGAEDRSPVLRSIWQKLPKTQKAYFLVRLIAALDVEVEEEFANFLAQGLRGSIEESDQKASLAFQIEQLSMSAKVNYPLRLRCLDIFAEKGISGGSLAAGRAALLFKVNKPEDAKKHLRTVMEAVTFSKSGSDPSDTRARFAFNRLLSSMGDEIQDHVLSVFADIEKQRGRTALTVRRLLTIRRQIGLQDDAVTVLERAVKDFPEEKSFHTLLATNLRRQGFWKRALEVQEAALDSSASSAAARNRLVRDWKNAYHPIRALKIRDAGVAARSQKATRPAKTPLPNRNSKSTATRTKAIPTLALKGRAPLKRIPATRSLTTSIATRMLSASTPPRKPGQPPSSIAAVKNAWEKKDEKGALTIFRRVWRIFSPTQADPYSRSILSASLGKFGPSQRVLWPPDAKKATKSAKAKPKEEARDRGGLPTIFTRALTAKDHAEHRPDFRKRNRTDQISAQSVLVKRDSGREEIQRLLQSLPPNLLDSAIAKDIYKALVDVEIAESSRDEVLDRLFSKERAGASNKVDLGKLTALLDEPDTGSPEQLAAYLPVITKNLNPRDEAQLRRLARLHVRCGQQGLAATLFQWCAVLRTSQGLGSPLRRFSNTDDLLDEVRRTLDGEHRIRALDSILKLSDPGEFARDNHLSTVLTIWLDLLDPKACLEQSRWALDAVTKFTMRPMRGACTVAAIIHARGGEVDQAIRCLEIALCKLPPPEKTAYPYYLDQFEVPGHLSQYDMVRLFPKETPNSPQSRDWLVRAGESVLDWRAAKRLPQDNSLSLMALLTIRLHEAGLDEQAAAMLGAMTAQAGDAPDNQLVVADVLRLLGKSVTANTIELKLLEQGQLNVERIPELVVHTLASEGAAKGLALGEKASELTLHPRMIKALIEAAGEAGDDSARQRWEKLAAEATAARSKLDPPKKAPKSGAAKQPSPTPGGKTAPAGRKGRPATGVRKKRA